MGKSIDRTRPASTCLSTPAGLGTHLAAIRAAGGSVLRDAVAGVVTGSDAAGAVILRAIRKHRSGPWIIMFFNSPSTTWTPPSLPRSDP